MVRTGQWHRLCVRLAACILLGVAMGAASPAVAGGRARPATAVVCTVQAGDSKDADLYVVAGMVGGRWTDGPKTMDLARGAKAKWPPGGDKAPLAPRANRLMHKGDHLSLYRLEAGEIGEVTITSDGEALLHYEGTSGVRFDATITTRRATSRKAWSMPYPWAANPADYTLETDALALWSPRGTRPRWVAGEVLDSEAPAYRAIVARWLATRGIPKTTVESVTINQIVRSDIDGDGRKEVFISLFSPGILWPNGDAPRKDAFAYLLMRRLRPGSEQVQTVIVDASFANEPYMGGDILWVDGFCDIDGDGMAEVIDHTHYHEGESVNLLRWQGNRFVMYAGWGSMP